jgi:hypothetical protein
MFTRELLDEDSEEAIKDLEDSGAPASIEMISHD